MAASFSSTPTVEISEAVAAREGAGPPPPPIKGRRGVVSPDGGWVAYVDSDSGSNHVLRAALSRTRPSHSGDASARACIRGGARMDVSLFFSVALQEDVLESGVMSVDVAPLSDTLRVSAPRRIFGDAVTDAMIDARRHADYTPDGQRLLDAPASRRSGAAGAAHHQLGGAAAAAVTPGDRRPVNGKAADGLAQTRSPGLT